MVLHAALAGAVHTAEPCLGRVQSPNPACARAEHQGKGKPAGTGMAIGTSGTGNSPGWLFQHQNPRKQHHPGSGLASEIHA